MAFSPENLVFGETYRFDVTVKNGTSKFAGDLLLSPKICTLTICGDLMEGREYGDGYRELNDLVCEAFGAVLHLYGLTIRNWKRRSLSRFPDSIEHLEIEYAISYVVYNRTQSTIPARFRAFEFAAPSISQWVGNTVTQDEIFARYHTNRLFGAEPVPTEFTQELRGLGALTAHYRVSTYYSAAEISSGLKCSIRLTLALEECKPISEVMKLTHELIVFFTFLIGGFFDLDEIKLWSEDGDRNSFSLYFSRDNSLDKTVKWPWFPLSQNLRPGQQYLPSFPLSAFSQHFAFSDSERMYLKKYLAYREMRNTEEQFLGFFRLLEKLTFQSDSYLPEERLASLLERSKEYLERYFNDRKNVRKFIEKIPRTNRSKVNTAACLVKFLKTLPKPLTEKWALGVADIEKICKLRNDLTHANEGEPEDINIDQAAKFIEALLVTVLLQRLGIGMDDAVQFLPRLDAYFLILKPPEVAISNMT